MTMKFMAIVEHVISITHKKWNAKLEDLKVLRRSPDLLNNCKIIVKVSYSLYNETYFVLPYMWVAAILVQLPKQSNSRVISEKRCLDRNVVVSNEWPWI